MVIAKRLWWEGDWAFPGCRFLSWNSSVLLAPQDPGVGMCWKDEPASLPCSPTTSPGTSTSSHTRTHRNIKHLLNFSSKHPDILFPSVPQHSCLFTGLTWDGSLFSLVLLSTAQTVSRLPGEGRMKSTKPVSLLTILLCEE